jgi:zinc transport system permease protein
LKKLMIYSILSAVVLTVVGLWLSYLFDLPSGATIVLVLAVIFFISALVKKITSILTKAHLSVLT